MNVGRIPVDTHYQVLADYGVPPNELLREELWPQQPVLGWSVDDERVTGAVDLVNSRRGLVTEAEYEEILEWHYRRKT